MAECGSAQCTFTFCQHCVAAHMQESWDAVQHALLRGRTGGPGWLCPCWSATPTPPQ